MLSSQQCIQEAERCHARAQATESKTLRNVFEDVAKRWRKLAEEQEVRAHQCVLLMDIGASCSIPAAAY
jgi:hypothetical protein